MIFVAYLFHLRLSSVPKVTLALLTHIDLFDKDTLPTEVFYLIDDTLDVMYPPRPELLSTSLQLVRLVGEVISSAPLSLIVPLLTAIRKSLCRWIEDRSEVLLEEEYNSVVRVRAFFGSITTLP